MAIVWKHGPPTDEEWAEIVVLAASGDLFFWKVPDRATAHWHTNPDGFVDHSEDGQMPESVYELHSHDFPVVGHSHGRFL